MRELDVSKISSAVTEMMMEANYILVKMFCRLYTKL